MPGGIGGRSDGGKETLAVLPCPPIMADLQPQASGSSEALAARPGREKGHVAGAHFVTSPEMTVRSGEVSACPARAAPPDPGGTTTLRPRTHAQAREQDMRAPFDAMRTTVNADSGNQRGVRTLIRTGWGRGRAPVLCGPPPALGKRIPIQHHLICKT
jgi:hypothetical protein